MPLPTPQANETSDQFIGRCMTDRATNAEFPDTQQRLAVCGSIYANHKKQEFESYADYGEGIRNNAKRGIELNERNGNKCATQTGKVRAQQLADGKAISLSTIKRMHSYLSRAETYYDHLRTSIPLRPPIVPPVQVFCLLILRLPSSVIRHLSLSPISYLLSPTTPPPIN